MPKQTFADKIAAVGLVEAKVLGAIPAEHLHPISQVAPNDWNPKECNEARLVALAHSLAKNGWLPHDLPLLWRDKPKHLTIINGEHRWKILNAAGFERYPGIVTSAVKCREDGMALTMELEEAKARRDGGKYQNNLMELARAGRDAELRDILRQSGEQLRELARQRAETVRAEQRERIAAGPPRVVTLAMPGDAFVRWQDATTRAKSALKQAGVAADLVEALSAGDLVDLALLWRERKQETP